MSLAQKLVSMDPTHALEIQAVFKSVVENEKAEGKSYTQYAHHLARACWHGTRVTLRQTSPEAEEIYDFILELHRACDGQWGDFCDLGVQRKDLDRWLDFAGMFMSALGNYYVSKSYDLHCLILIVSPFSVH